MRVLFMGTPEFAIPSLEMIYQNDGLELIGVVTQPDRPAGRGQKVRISPVKSWAIKHGLSFYQPEKVKGNKDFLLRVRQLKPDVIVVVAFGQLLPANFLEIPLRCCINLHASLLPRHRGASPIQAAILEGDEYTGVTTMLMEERLDAGDILLQEKVKIEEGETGGSLHDKLKVVGAQLLEKTLNNLSQITPVPQDEKSATYTGKITRDDGEINWQLPAKRIERMVRAYNPWPGAFTTLEGKRFKIWQAGIISHEDIQGKPGEIIRATEDRIIVQAGQGLLSLDRVQLAGRKVISASEFIRGFQLNTGEILGSNQ